MSSLNVQRFRFCQKFVQVQYLVEADCRFLLFAHHQAVMDTMEETLKKMKVGYIRRSDEGFRIGLSQELVGGLGY